MAWDQEEEELYMKGFPKRKLPFDCKFYNNDFSVSPKGQPPPLNFLKPPVRFQRKLEM